MGSKALTTVLDALLMSRRALEAHVVWLRLVDVGALGTGDGSLTPARLALLVESLLGRPPQDSHAVEVVLSVTVDMAVKAGVVLPPPLLARVVDRVQAQESTRGMWWVRNAVSRLLAPIREKEGPSAPSKFE